MTEEANAHPLSAKPARLNPFVNMNIESNGFLKDITERSPCSKCHKSRKFFCYTCYIPVTRLSQLIPNVKVIYIVTSQISVHPCPFNRSSLDTDSHTD